MEYEFDYTKQKPVGGKDCFIKVMNKKNNQHKNKFVSTKDNVHKNQNNFIDSPSKI